MTYLPTLTYVFVFLRPKYLEQILILRKKYNTLCFLKPGIGFYYKSHTELPMLDNSGFQTTHIQ